MYTRIIKKQVIDACFQKKALVIYGPRQVGKTTLCQEVLNHFDDRPTLYVSGDDLDVIQTWKPSSTLLTGLVAGYDLIIIDEAQRISDIGLVIKMLVDMFPDKQIIATGSSSFDLANTIVEPLTGRALFWYLYPLSIQEIYPTAPLADSILHQRLIYGSYPDVVTP